VETGITQERRAALHQRLDGLLSEVESAAIGVRRHLHRHPELGWHEHRTQRFLSDWLEAAGLEPHPVAKTGLVVDVGAGDAPVIYRADIDALPIQDMKQRGGAAVVSEVQGVCHACGHDLHTAVAAGLARALHRLGPDLPGRVRFVFQPAEEVFPCGAAAVLSEGVAKGARAALALHADPMRDTGHVGVRVGPLTATSDKISVEVIGESGHGARPHLAHDAILGAAGVVQALYAMISRVVDPVEPAVLSLGTIHGGDADNVIAGRVRLTGTLRTLYNDTRERLHREVRRTAEAAALVHGCSADVSFALGSPPTHNDPRLHKVLKLAADDVLGPSGVVEVTVPSTGAEDFGEFSAALPTYMLRVGVRTPGHPTRHLHTPTFDVDERAIGVAMRVMGRAILATFDAISEPEHR